MKVPILEMIFMHFRCGTERIVYVSMLIYETR